MPQQNKTITIYPFDSRLHTIYDPTLEILSKNYILNYNFSRNSERGIFYKLKSNLFLLKVYRYFIEKLRKTKRLLGIQKKIKIEPKNNLLFCFNKLPPPEYDFILDLETVTGPSNYNYEGLNKEYISNRLTSKKCKAIICWNKSSYLSLTKIIDCSKFKNKIKIIPFGAKYLGIQKKDKPTLNFLFVSSINNPQGFKAKGGLIALEAFSRLSKKYKNIKFFVRANVNKKTIKKYKKIPGIIFLRKYLPKDKINKLMQNSNILFEAAPGIELLLECMSFGIPAISLDFWCLEEMILDKKSGFLIDSSGIFGDRKNIEKYVKESLKNHEKLYNPEKCIKIVEEFVKKGEILIKNRKLLKKMGEKQQSLVKDNGKYSLKKRNNNLINLINSIYKQK